MYRCLSLFSLCSCFQLLGTSLSRCIGRVLCDLRLLCHCFVEPDVAVYSLSSWRGEESQQLITFLFSLRLKELGENDERARDDIRGKEEAEHHEKG